MENPYVTPQASSHTLDAPTRNYGGLKRLPYILSLIGLYFAAGVFGYFLLASNFDESSPVSGEDAASFGFQLLGFVVVFLIIGIVLAALRFKNQGSSGWMSLLTLIPIANIWAGWRLFACQEGYKDIGHLDSAGKILTWLFVGLIVLGIVANIMMETGGTSGY